MPALLTAISAIAPIAGVLVGFNLRRMSHRHRYVISVPGAIVDVPTGVTLRLDRLFCRCGLEDEYGRKLVAALTWPNRLGYWLPDDKSVGLQKLLGSR